jgi:acetyl-CoA synthetase
MPDQQTISTDSLMTEKRTFPPSPEVVARAHLNAEQYRELYDRSVNDPDGFWLEQARTLDWIKEPTVARKYNWNTAARNIEHTWFEDGQLNITTNCLDRHLASDLRTKPAIIWQGEPEEDTATLTYEDLHRETCKFANVLKSHGVKKGDRVCIYLPMILELPVEARHLQDLSHGRVGGGQLDQEQLAGGGRGGPVGVTDAARRRGPAGVQVGVAQ